MAVGTAVFVRNRDESRNATALEVVKKFEEAWLGHYPKPLNARFDPEGCFRSNEWSEMLTQLDIVPDPTAGEAQWQLGDVERTVPALKEVMQKDAEANPQLEPEQIVARATSVHNELERIKV